MAALVACAALLAGVGCGSDEEEPRPGVPRAAADQLSRELDLLQERIDVTREQSEPGSCGDIESKSYPDIQEILDGLPENTDPDVRRALERSIDRLKELADSECAELIGEIEKRREEAPPVTTPPPTPAPPPTTTPEPTDTQPEPEEEERKKKKPKENDEQDNGDGGLGPNGQGPPGQDGGGQPAPAPEGD